MEVAMSLSSLVRLPLSASRARQSVPVKISVAAPPKRRRVMVVQAKGRKRFPDGRPMQQQRQMPALPKLEEDGNPKFLIFVAGNNTLWYPLSIVTGGSTAKILLSAKDNFLGKYIYKDTLDRNLASVLYNDEKNLQEMAKKQHRLLRGETKFRYGYKIVDNKTLRDALSTTSNIVKLPSQDKLVNSTVVGKVQKWFENVKKSFGSMLVSDTYSIVQPVAKSEEDSDDED